ncbi:cardiolipin synthase [Nesterenkonia muleiensis]|uniref:cardiolipin synthase n=1 Tax=Nesterenkonia muleiensis TaxID=2282648 RepID=UPI000E72FC3B|nr:cardiolipin synthase [Nesterenkonia muleiensis]
MTLSSVLMGVFIAVDLIIKVVAIGVVPENRKPSSSTAWLLIILFFPFIGLPLFLLIGSPYINKRRQRIQARANTILATGAEQLPSAPPTVELSGELRGVVELTRSLTSLPMVTGSNLGVEMDYQRCFERMAELVKTAEETVEVEFYIVARDSTTEGFFLALAAAVRRGVKVRLLLDHIGSRKYPGFTAMQSWMTEVGIDWHFMLPFRPFRGSWKRPDLRNHRKLLVVDGRVAMMGSANLIGSTYGSEKNHRMGRHWHDIMVELTGEIVSSLEAVFAVDWYSETGEVINIHAYRFSEHLPDERLLPSAHGPEREVGGSVNALQLIPSGPGFRTSASLRAFNSLMYTAKERLAIVSPYFVPEESLLEAMTTAAMRGVQVELYVSEQADQFMVDRAQSSYYQALLDAGVKIYMYPAPQVLHTKCFLIDQTCAVLGSSNMDMRSFGLNYEISLLATGGNVVEQIHGVIAEYQRLSTLVDPEEWPKRSVARRYSESVMRLTSALQ